MRHGESYNNLLSVIDYQRYLKERLAEPELSEVGQDSCRRMGAETSKLGFTFQKIICSPQKRAILSAKLFREGFGCSDDNLPIHLNEKCYEFIGVHMGGKCYPGLTRKQILEQC